MSGYPYGNPQYPPPQNQIYPTLYNPTYVPAPGQPGAMAYPVPGQNQYPSPGFMYQQQAQPGHPGHPASMSYPSAPIAPSAVGNNYAAPPHMQFQPGATVQWIPSTAMHAQSLSDRAVVAGYEGIDGSPLWVIRARFEGDLIPGKLAVKHHGAYVAWGGNENPVDNFEVCCAHPESVRWLESRDGNIPPNAVVGGNISNGEPLFIGRARHEGSLTPGKIHRTHGCLYISYGGKEIPHKVYEVLCTV